MAQSSVVSGPEQSGRAPACEVSGLDSAVVQGWRQQVTALAHAALVAPVVQSPPEAAGDADEALALIGELESLCNAAAAAQAALAVRVDRGRRVQEAAAGVPARRRGRGVAAELGLARRFGGSRGARLLGLAKVLTAEMPCTFAALARGDLTEWRATLLARETACLPVEDRAAVDADLCADPGTLAGKGDRAVVAAAKQAAYRLDPHSVMERNKVAERDRRVWVAPAHDQMAYLTALLPLTQAVATYAALKRAADSARATGQAGDRGRGQVMADELVSRVTGLAEPSRVPVRVNLLMTDASLFHGDGEPGLVPGFGPVPAAWARGQLSGEGAAAWVRRLYTAPGSGDLVAMDSGSRQVPAGLAEFISLRDQGCCRMPWCDAPLRHDDHVVPVEAGGRTSAENLQGLCEAHNYAKQAPGWQMRPRGGAGDGVGREVEIRTPSGQILRSRAPAPPRGRPRVIAVAMVQPLAQMSSTVRTRAARDGATTRSQRRRRRRRSQRRRAAAPGPSP